MPGVYDYTAYVNNRTNYVSRQFFNTINQDRRYTLSEEAANILENLLRDKDKKFANLLRKYIQQSTIMETE